VRSGFHREHTDYKQTAPLCPIFCEFLIKLIYLIAKSIGSDDNLKNVNDDQRF
jgi:hypothetical protein